MPDADTSGGQSGGQSGLCIARVLMSRDKIPSRGIQRTHSGEFLHCSPIVANSISLT